MKLSASLCILLHNELLSLSDAKHVNCGFGCFKNIENSFCRSKTIRHEINILHYISSHDSIKIIGVIGILDD